MSSDPKLSALDSSLDERLARGALLWPTRRALVQATGADARGFVHRMCTQHVEALARGEARLAALTNKQGRLMDVVHVVALAEDDVLLLGTKAEGAPLVEWLDEFLFVEDVELRDRSGEGSLLLVAGTKALSVASSALGGAPDLPPWQAYTRDDVLVVRGFDLLAAGERVPSLLIWHRTDDGESLEQALSAQGVVRGTDEELETARVATGVPGPAEVSERYNPLELALHDAIHWAKGCYIGQEVIARIDNYGKQARQLVGLTLDDESAREALRPTAEVRVDGKAIGQVTSVSPRFVPGGVSALAVVKLRGDAEGSALEIVGEGGDTLRALARRPASAQVPHD